MLKRIIAIVFLGLLASCSNPEVTLENEKKTVVIVNLMQHPSLDLIEDGVESTLNANGYSESSNLKFIKLNASGDKNLGPILIEQAQGYKPDLIVAITTPIAQNAVNKDNGTPIVFAAVTDPVGASIIENLDEPMEYITGTSDAWPYREQLELVLAITPDVQNLGIIYNPGEAASQYGIAKIRELAPAMGFKLQEVPASNTNEVYSAASAAARRSEALFLSSDNTVISGMPGALKVAIEEGLPLYVGDSGTVKNGGLAAVSVGYEQLGLETGNIAVRLLNGEKNIPVYVGTGDEIHLNLKTAEVIGLEIPEEVVSQATAVYNSIGNK